VTVNPFRTFDRKQFVTGNLFLSCEFLVNEFSRNSQSSAR
jgi:hypothetical protein